MGGEQLGEEAVVDLYPEAELDAHVGKDTAAQLHDLLLQLEGGDAVGEQAADLRVAVVDGCRHAVAGQHVGAGQPGRAGADHRHTPAAGLDPAEVRPPAHLQGGVDDVFLDGADGHRAEIVIEGAGALAEAVLGADPAADLRQAVGLVAELCRLDDAPGKGEAQPVGDVVVHRAAPLAVGVAAGQAAVGLHARLAALEGVGDLDEAAAPLLDSLLLRVDPLHLDELIEIAAHPFLLTGSPPGFPAARCRDGRAGWRHPRSSA